MPILPRNIVSHEWIGLKIEILESSDPTIQGISGLVRDETRNMLIVETKGQLRQIVKRGNVFRATLPTGEGMTVHGIELKYRPEDRVKKGHTRW